MSDEDDTMKSSDLVKIWFLLLALLFLSIFIGMTKNVGLATVLIFGIATIKALLVALYYMGLKYEPRAVAAVLLSSLGVVIILFCYLIPDMVYVYGRL